MLLLALLSLWGYQYAEHAEEDIVIEVILEE